MNGAARRCHETLEALGFARDEERSTRDQSWWTHPADPEHPIKVWAHIKDEVATVKIARARQVAGLATVGATVESTAKERARIRRQDAAKKRVAAKLAHEKALAPYQEKADAKAAEKEAKRRLQQRVALQDAVQDAREELARVNRRGHDPRAAMVQLQIARDRLRDYTVQP